MHILIAHGPNDIKIPCRIFKEKEDAFEFLSGFGEITNDSLVSDGQISEELSEALFTSHYYGCGECWKIAIKEAKFNEKLTSFDLD